MISFDNSLYHVMQRGAEVGSAFKLICELLQGFSHSGIEHDVSAGDRVRRSEHSEFKLVARKCKRRGAVAVGVVALKSRKNVYAELHCGLFGASVGGIVLDSIKDCLKLVTEEY